MCFLAQFHSEAVSTRLTTLLFTASIGAFHLGIDLLFSRSVSAVDSLERGVNLNLFDGLGPNSFHLI
jgi:hypothetical protein